VTYLAGTGCSSSVFESLSAQTPIGANGVLAAAVQSANITTVNATLIDVNAVVVRSNRMTRWTDAMIPALSVLASLALAALVRSLLTFVYVDAVLSRCGVQGITGPADHSGRASVKFPRV